mmetsp:Transcript_19384/g.46824  ORF Transcript_19384/g.46824 Transcript_19384/m.46824 type:complete len:319 (-) Transcript_19384:1169-2125(-)
MKKKAGDGTTSSGGETTPLVDKAVKGENDDDDDVTTIRRTAIQKWFKVFNILFIAYCVLLFVPATVCLSTMMEMTEEKGGFKTILVEVLPSFIRAWFYIATWTVMYVIVNGTMAWNYPSIYIMRSDSSFTNDGPRFGNLATFLILISLLFTWICGSITYALRRHHDVENEGEELLLQETSSSSLSRSDSFVILLFSLFGLVVHWLGYVIMHIVPIQNKFAQKNLTPQQQADASEQHIVSTGLYGYVRHPMYSGLLMYQIGFSVYFQSWLASSMGLFLIIGLTIRIYLEENQLLESSSLSTQYKEYMEQVKYRIIPGIC